MGVFGNTSVATSAVTLPPDPITTSFPMATPGPLPSRSLTHHDPPEKEATGIPAVKPIMYWYLDKPGTTLGPCTSYMVSVMIVLPCPEATGGELPPDG